MNEICEKNGHSVVRYRGMMVCEVCGETAEPLPEQDLLEEVVAERTAADAGFPLLVDEALLRLRQRREQAPYTTLRLTDVPGETAEVAALSWLIQRPAGFNIDLFGGLLALRRTLNGDFVVSEPAIEIEFEFSAAPDAARKFLELSKEYQRGLDPIPKSG